MTTPHENVLTINTDYDITNTGELIVFVEFVRAKLNHSKFRCMYNVTLSQNKNE